MVFRVFLALLWLAGLSDFARAVDYYFPVMAAGFTSAGSDTFYVTEFVINNPNRQRVTGFLSFYSPDGVPMDVGLRFVDGTGSSTTGTDSLFQVSIPAGGTFRAYTTETGVLKTGWVLLDSDNFVNPLTVFSLNSRSTGLISEAAVLDSSPGRLQRLFADTLRRSSYISSLADTASSDTGIAIVNTSPQRAAVTIRLVDSTGRTTQTASITLTPLASTSRFLKEFFPALPAFQGAVELQSDVPVTSLGLRFTGAVFTTIPVAVVE